MRFLLAVLITTACWASDQKIIVAGLGGEPDYDSRFTMLALEAQKLMGGEALTSAKATKANLQAAIAKAAAQTKPEDTFVLLLIGHGTFDGVIYKFNVPGPDLSAEELRGWLDKVPAKQLVVLATSASGAAQQALKASNRVVVTATRTGTEKNAVVFGRYWVEAMRDASADGDKNEAVSAAEAFKYAQQKTTQFYEAQKRLATEHAVLDDGGGLAARLAVVRFGAAQKALNDPVKRLLLKRKDDIEAAIDRLKLEKPAMAVADYKKQLNNLLVELAKVQEEIDK